MWEFSSWYLPLIVFIFIFVDKFHNIRDIAFQQVAQLIDCIGGNAVAFLDRVISGSRKAHFF